MAADRRPLGPSLLRAASLLPLALVAAGCAYQYPTAATSTTPPAPTPATITIASTVGYGNGAGEVYLDAYVKDADGKAVPGPVHFATTAGTVSPATVTAGTDGLAQATLSSLTPATITATAGSISASIAVTPIRPTTGTAGPPSDPPSSTLPAPTVTLDDTTGIVNAATVLVAEPTVVGGTVASFAWTFGDGSPTVTGAALFSTRHTYTTIGTYTASVTITDTLGRTASDSGTVTITAAPTVPHTLSADLTCSVSSKTATCNIVSLMYDGAAYGSANITSVDWDWGDGKSTSTSGPATTYTYSQSGSYTLTAIVHASTSSGAMTAPAGTHLTVN